MTINLKNQQSKLSSSQGVKLPRMGGWLLPLLVINLLSPVHADTSNDMLAPQTSTADALTGPACSCVRCGYLAEPSFWGWPGTICDGPSRLVPDPCAAEPSGQPTIWLGSCLLHRGAPGAASFVART